MSQSLPSANGVDNLLAGGTSCHQCILADASDLRRNDCTQLYRGAYQTMDWQVTKLPSSFTVTSRTAVTNSVTFSLEAPTQTCAVRIQRRGVLLTGSTQRFIIEITFPMKSWLLRARLPRSLWSFNIGDHAFTGSCHHCTSSKHTIA